MTDRSAYAVLGVDPDADDRAIKAAYRRRARACHPDRGGDAAEMADVNSAWLVLKDPESRKRYDRGDGEAQNQTHLQIQALLASVFLTLMEQKAIARTDMVKEARTIIRKAIADCTPESWNIRDRRSKLERMQHGSITAERLATSSAPCSRGSSNA